MLNDTRIGNVVIQWECQQLLTRITAATDNADWQTVADCYTEDALFYRPTDPDNPIRGKANILASLQARPPRTTAHLLSNCIFDVVKPDTVSAVSRVWHVTGPATGPASTSGDAVLSDGKILIGSFTDQLVRVDDHWLISLRRGSMQIKHGVEGIQ